MIPVLHLRQGAGLYGADRAVLTLAASQEAPFLPLIGTISRPGTHDALGDESQRRGVRTLRFESASRFDLSCARAIAQAARAEEVRLLHAHDFKALFVAVIAGWLSRIPVVATYHGDTAATWTLRLYEIIGRTLGMLQIVTSPVLVARGSPGGSARARRALSRLPRGCARDLRRR